MFIAMIHINPDCSKGYCIDLGVLTGIANAGTQQDTILCYIAESFLITDC